MAANENPYEPPVTPEPFSTNAVRLGSPEFDQDLWEIKKQTRNAFVLSMLGIFLCAPYIFSPAAIYCGKRALRMIEQHNKGHEFERTAKRAIQWGFLPLVLIGVFMIGVVLYAVVLIATSSPPQFDGTVSF